MTADSQPTFEGWAILELMGHRRLGGYVTEVELAGHGMLRLDVPEHPWQDGCTCGSEQPQSLDPEQHTHVCQMFREDGDGRILDVHATQFYSPSSLYCLTPTSERMARAIRSRPTPVQQWELPRTTGALQYIPTERAGHEEDDDQPF